MRIVLLSPGTGDLFYCENCLRDKDLARALRAAGHDALLVPLYLPLTDETDKPASHPPVFLGGINVYLQQKFALFRGTPRWIDRVFDSLGLLRFAGRFTGMTRANDLGATTISLLRGRDGRQKKEIDRLAAYLATIGPVDAVLLSNALLLGLARRIKDRLRVPVACMLQDEDEFLDALPEPLRRQAWAHLSQRADDADVFIAPSRYFADAMRQRMPLPANRLHVVLPGIDPDRYAPPDGGTSLPSAPPTVGFLSRLCRDKGLDVLVEAFILLKSKTSNLKSPISNLKSQISNPPSPPALAGLRLRAAGGSTSSDDAFLNSIRRRLHAAGVAEDVDLLPNFSDQRRAEFLRSLTVLSVPERRGEAAGLYLLESMAAGVPVVQPSTGVSPELLAATGAGVIYEGDSPPALAAALERVLTDAPLRADLSGRGRQAAAGPFHIRRPAAEIAAILKPPFNIGPRGSASAAARGTAPPPGRRRPLGPSCPPPR